MLETKVTNSVALVRKLIYRPSGRRLAAKLVPTFVAVDIDFLDPKPLLFYSNSSSIILTRLSGPRSRPITENIRQRRKSNPGSLDL
jgi:hypothetical protein